MKPKVLGVWDIDRTKMAKQTIGVEGPVQV